MTLVILLMSGRQAYKALSSSSWHSAHFTLDCLQGDLVAVDARCVLIEGITLCLHSTVERANLHVVRRCSSGREFAWHDFDGRGRDQTSTIALLGQCDCAKCAYLDAELLEHVPVPVHDFCLLPQRAVLRL